jgi:hypothetical protein
MNLAGVQEIASTGTRQRQFAAAVKLGFEMHNSRRIKMRGWEVIFFL